MPPTASPPGVRRRRRERRSATDGTYRDPEPYDRLAPAGRAGHAGARRATNRRRPRGRGAPRRRPASACRPRPAADAGAATKTKRNGGMRSALVGGIAGALVGALIAGGIVVAFDDNPTAAARAHAVSAASDEPRGPRTQLVKPGDIRSILDAARPAVVRIDVGERTATKRRVPASSSTRRRHRHERARRRGQRHRDGARSPTATRSQGDVVGADATPRPRRRQGRQDRPARRSSSATPTRSRSVTRSSRSATRSACRKAARDRHHRHRLRSRPCRSTSAPRRWSTRSRPTPRSTPATPVVRSSTSNGRVIGINTAIASPRRRTTSASRSRSPRRSPSSTTLRDGQAAARSRSWV